MPWSAAIGAVAAMQNAYSQSNRARGLSGLQANQLRSLADLSNNLAASQYANAYSNLAPDVEAVKRQQDAYIAAMRRGMDAARQAARVDVLYGYANVRPSYPSEAPPAPAAAKPEPATRPKVTPEQARKYRAILFPRWHFHSPFRGLELWLYRMLSRYAHGSGAAGHRQLQRARGAGSIS